MAQGQSESRAIPAGGREALEFPLAISPAADLFPYQRGAALLLRLELRTDRPGGLTPADSAFSIRTRESTLTLPLIDYHDPVEESFLTAGPLRWQRPDASERLVNPGKTARFALELRNDGPVTRPATIDVEGLNMAWAQARPASLRVSGASQVPIHVHVSAPNDASPGERAELFVIAQDGSAPATLALTRIRATVVDASVMDVPDDTLEDPASEPATPAPAGVWAAVALLGAALLRAIGNLRDPRSRNGRRGV